MAPSPLRRLLEDRVSQLLADADTVAGESRQRAVRECAEQLNQSVRRLRQAATLAELGATLVDSASRFASGAALFVVEGENARLESVRGIEAEEIPARFEIPLVSAPALGGAVETRDPVIAAAAPSEISEAVADLLGHSQETRVSLIPLVAGDVVPAVMYCWGTVEESALELLTQVAAANWNILTEPVAEPAPELVTIAGAVSPAVEAFADAGGEAHEPKSWESLSAEEQQVHLRAQRYARVHVAEMRLFEAEAVQAGRSKHDVYGGLRKSIDAARAEFQETFFAACPSMLDYLHLELVRTLAHDDADLLGPEYPGPLV